MHLERSEEQRMLFESAARFLKTRGPETPWVDIGEMGWIAAALTEADGGLGGRACDVLPICEAIGACGAELPYFSSALLPAGLLARLPAFERRSELIESFLSGQSRVVLAHTEHSLVFTGETPSLQAPSALPARLSGVKRRVWDGEKADFLIVSVSDRSGLAWFLVEARQPGVCIEPSHADREMPFASITLSDASASPLCAGDAAQAAFWHASSLATVGVLAESVGCMSELLKLTREWLLTRAQFGRPLAANQVLQHRLVDMLIALEESKSMLNLAAYAHDNLRTEDARTALHAAKAHIANCARFVGQQAVHLHGALGLTEEMFVGRAYRRLEALNATFGGADYHTWAYALRPGSSAD